VKKKELSSEELQALSLLLTSVSLGLSWLAIGKERQEKGEAGQTGQAEQLAPMLLVRNRHGKR
jgi:hypothetical protein